MTWNDPNAGSETSVVTSSNSSRSPGHRLWPNGSGRKGPSSDVRKRNIWDSELGASRLTQDSATTAFIDPKAEGLILP